MSPWVGVSAASSSRMNVDLPEPDGPIRKTNSPLSILTETLSSAGRADDLYSFDTWSRVIITARQCSGGFAQPGHGYCGAAGVAGTVPVVVGGRMPGGNGIVTAGSGPEPSGSITVVVGCDDGDVGLVVSPGDVVVVVSVGLVVVVVVVLVVTGSGPRTLGPGTHVH